LSVADFIETWRKEIPPGFLIAINACGRMDWAIHRTVRRECSGVVALEAKNHVGVVNVFGELFECSFGIWLLAEGKLGACGDFHALESVTKFLGIGVEFSGDSGDKYATRDRIHRDTVLEISLPLRGRRLVQRSPEVAERKILGGCMAGVEVLFRMAIQQGLGA
jgi:hypothetical protein